MAVSGNYRYKEACRICAGRGLVKILDLGAMPPANAFLTKKDLLQPERIFPLSVYFCPQCSLVQLRDVVSPALLFSTYHFLTSASAPAMDHFIRLGEMVRSRFITSPHDLVIDIGGNDGVMLASIKEACRVLNIDPAKNIKELSEARGVPVVLEFFTSTLAEELVKKYGAAKVVTASNVIAHTDALHDVFRGVRTLIGDGGTFIFEVHWVKNLVGEGGFDQVYHEHLCYFSLHALQRLAEVIGLTIFDVESVPMQGESLRVYAAKNRKPEPSVEKFLGEERMRGLADLATYRDFFDKVTMNKMEFSSLIKELRRQRKRIVGYGAAAKGNTLLNYFGIDDATLDFIVDTTPLKQGFYTPGTHIPVVPPEELRRDLPDYVLVLAWNFADAILKKEQQLRDRGVQFIIPVPQVRIV